MAASARFLHQKLQKLCTFHQAKHRKADSFFAYGYRLAAGSYKTCPYEVFDKEEKKLCFSATPNYYALHLPACLFLPKDLTLFNISATQRQSLLKRQSETIFIYSPGIIHFNYLCPVEFLALYYYNCTLKN
jgi:hypothetical protein